MVSRGSDEDVFGLKVTVEVARVVNMGEPGNDLTKY